MAVEACRQAIDDAGLSIDDVDGITCFLVNDSATPIEVGWALGRQELAWCPAVLAGGNAVAEQIAMASAVIEAGLCKAVLVYRSLNGRSGHRFGTVTGPMAVPGDGQVDVSSGFLVPPQWFAMWARRHQYETGSTAEDLGQIAITQRAHAVPNEHAIRRDPLSMDEYLAGRWIAEPFRIFDCTSEVDGACAVLLVGEDLARDVKTTPIWLLGSSNAQSGSGWMNWDDPTRMYARSAGPKIWERTGLRPEDMDLACMYDCFTYTVMATMEGYGFCERGEVGAFFREPDIGGVTGSVDQRNALQTFLAFQTAGIAELAHQERALLFKVRPLFLEKLIVVHDGIVEQHARQAGPHAAIVTIDGVG